MVFYIVLFVYSILGAFLNSAAFRFLWVEDLFNRTASSNATNNTILTIEEELRERMEALKVLISPQSLLNTNVTISLLNFVASISMQIYKQLLLEYIELSLIPYIVYSPAILIMPVIDLQRPSQLPTRI